MIDQIIFSLAVSAATHSMKKDEEIPLKNRSVIIRRFESTQTEPTYADLSLDNLFAGSAATYQPHSALIIEDIEIPFVSPIKKSIEVEVSYIIGGKIMPLPLDDELVYFDE